MSETSTDVSSSFHPASILPGFKSSFIAVGRNMKQWRQCVSLNEGKNKSVVLLQNIPSRRFMNGIAVLNCYKQRATLTHCVFVWNL